MQLRSVLLLSAAVAAVSPTVLAQYAERPHLIGSGQKAVDASGRSIKNPRVRAVHTVDADLVGGTAYFLRYDPFLAYQLGRNLNFREFRERDGTFDKSISGLGGPMPDGTTAKITTNNQTSCVGCHNLPDGNPGGGANFSKDSGRGRNSPHYYGAGLVEMIAARVRSEMLAQADANGDGWISVAEAQNAPDPCLIEPSPGGPMIDFGSPRLDGGSSGRPQFNNILRVWYVDAQGRHVPNASGIDGVNTVGYDVEVVVWGWGQGQGRAALNPTNRAFLWDPWKAHGGLEAYDPSTSDDPEGDGVSAPTLAGAVQFPATHQPGDKGATLDPLGFSRDDPDGDGHLNEISEGDLDLAEWFLLNAPRPAFAGTEREYQAGLAALQSLGCSACHVPDWDLPAQDATHPGDRRLFDLQALWNPAKGRLEGHLVRLFDKVGASYVRRFKDFKVRGVFSDFAHHDMGEGFREVDFSGTRNSIWRTPPLWGVGSGFPWGHDGSALTIEEAIRRHGGEAAASRAAWLSAPDSVRNGVLAFLSKLVLYDIESLPCDVDGDGAIAEHFVVAGVDTGYERFNAEWLFRVPVRIQGLVQLPTNDGAPVRSFAATNLTESYGLNLPLRRDSDADGWPDVWDEAPNAPGFKDGVH